MQSYFALVKQFHTCSLLSIKFTPSFLESCLCTWFAYGLEPLHTSTQSQTFDDKAIPTLIVCQMSFQTQLSSAVYMYIKLEEQIYSLRIKDATIRNNETHTHSLTCLICSDWKFWLCFMFAKKEEIFPMRNNIMLLSNGKTSSWNGSKLVTKFIDMQTVRQRHRHISTCYDNAHTQILYDYCCMLSSWFFIGTRASNAITIMAQQNTYTEQRTLAN